MRSRAATLAAAAPPPTSPRQRRQTAVAGRLPVAGVEVVPLVTSAAPIVIRGPVVRLVVGVLGLLVVEARSLLVVASLCVQGSRLLACTNKSHTVSSSKCSYCTQSTTPAPSTRQLLIQSFPLQRLALPAETFSDTAVLHHTPSSRHEITIRSRGSRSDTQATHMGCQMRPPAETCTPRPLRIPHPGPCTLRRAPADVRRNPFGLSLVPAAAPATSACFAARPGQAHARRCDRQRVRPTARSRWAG